MFRPWSRFACLLAFALVVGVGTPFIDTASAADEPSKLGPDPKQYEATVSKAVDYLQTKGQSSDGSYSKRIGVGATALITTGLLRHGRSPNDPLVNKSLKFLEGFVQPDGGIYSPKGGFANYETCLAVMCFSEANADKRYDKLLANANKFLRGLQWDGEEGHDKESVYFGGGGYAPAKSGGEKNRPDLSNTAFLVDALKSSGSKADDQAIKNALVFVSRCQNLETEHNTTPFAARVNDGGFYYSGAVDEDKTEDRTPNGGLRSYGTMTYAGLKSLIFAGLKPDDPRVKAAVGWISKNYDVKANPGMGDAGLFYYYQTFGKTLDALGHDTLTDAKGVKHDWRKDLAEELARRQKPDGSWVNDNSKWMEGDPNLATGFALLALSYCKPKVK
jgi:squalene-hopene/tetraprenyl-beta-curcumene cyclase